MLYLDNCATTKVEESVLEAMLPYFINFYGNPDSKFYEQAVEAKKAINDARINIAKLINCNPRDVIFNSGSTEGNNTVLKGVIDSAPKGSKIITTVIEHSSVYETCKFLESQGVDITYLQVNRAGLINIEELVKEMNETTALVSVIWVNNELGSIQPIKEIADICWNKNIPLHVDATQAIGRIKINLKEIPGISFMTFSGHKIYGPKGVGALIMRESKNGKYFEYTPLIHGGSQEKGFRSGTSNVPGIVGLGKACELFSKNINENLKTLKENTEKVKQILLNKYNNNIVINNDLEKCAPGIINVRFIGINNELLLKSISKFMAASTGSACSNIKPSRILKSIGLTEKEISESIRISLPLHMSESDFCELENL